MSMTLINSFITSGGGGGGPTCLAKAIDGETPEFQSYDKAVMWSSDNGSLFTFAAFLRVPKNVASTEGLIFGNNLMKFYVKDWNGITNKFLLDFNTSGFGAQYLTFTADKTVHGLEVGDWFALMVSMDYSGATPTFNAYTHKRGDTAAIDIEIAPLFDDGGPMVWAFDDASEITAIASHPAISSTSMDIELEEFYFTNEFVDWSDSAERDKYVGADGEPVGLGDGSDLTGTAAKMYLPSGDGTDNQGTAGDFTAENGPIVDAATSACD